jgi:uncharacterized protein YciI
MNRLFVISYGRGGAWIAGKPVFEQPLKEHLAYMRDLTARRILILGGPFTDDLGGLIVVRVETQQDADAIWNDDPAVLAGVMTAEAHPWMLMAGTDILTPAAA